MLTGRPALGLIVAFAGLCAAARAADAPRKPEWLAGDPGVLAWPSADFTAAERMKQAQAGGLSWMAVCHTVVDEVLADPNAVERFQGLKQEGLRAIFALRFEKPAPIAGDIVCLGVDPDLPFPRHNAQDVINWTNSLGGVAILSDAGPGLRYAAALSGFAAFEAFRNGRWAADCSVGGEWDLRLAGGQRLFIVGSSHEPTRPVLGRGAAATCVLAASNSEGDIADAIRAGRAVVAERGVIRMNFTVEGQPPGSVVTARKGLVEIAVEVTADEEVDEVLIIGNTRPYRPDIRGSSPIEVLSTIPIGAKHAVKTVSLELARSTRYVRAVARIHKGDCRTLTNPVFIGGIAPAPAVNRAQQLVDAALASMGGDDAGALLAPLLENRDLGPATAVYLARRLDRKQLDHVRPLLLSSNREVRTLAAYVLWRVAGAEALPSVLPLLDEQDRVPRLFAARMLARFARPEHLALAQRAAEDPSREVRLCGLAALARIPSAESLARLRRALFDQAEIIRQGAAIQLSLMLALPVAGEQQFLAAFRTGMLDAKLAAVVPRADLRPLVQQAAAVPMVEPLVMLRRALFDTDEFVRWDAARQLGLILDVPEAQRAEFIAAFKKGQVEERRAAFKEGRGEPKTTLEMVRRADLRPLAGQAAAIELVEAEQLKSLASLRQALFHKDEGVRRDAATRLRDRLGLDESRREEFLAAFKKGKLDPKLLEAVSRPDLRPRVEEAAAEYIAEAGPLASTTEPGKVGPAGLALRTLDALPVSEQMRVDGRPDEAIWQAAKAAGGFVLVDGAEPKHATTVRVAYDADNLYLFFECTEPAPEQIVAREEERDATVWLDDSVDLFICPSADRTEKDPQYFHFCVNTRGVQFDEVRTRRFWNAEWQAAAAVGTAAWTLEVALPFRSLGKGAPAKGQTRWLVNFLRHRRVKPEEDSFFAPGARSPETYAELKFE